MDVDDEDDIGMDCFAPTQTDSNPGGEDEDMEDDDDEEENGAEA